VKCEWCKCKTDELHEVCLYNGHDIYVLRVCEECYTILDVPLSSNESDTDEF
jgi:hypothetical protein